VVLEALRDLALDQDREEPPDARGVVALVRPDHLASDVLDVAVRKTAMQAKDHEIEGLFLSWLHGSSEPCSRRGAQGLLARKDATLLTALCDGGAL
jgi:hypothetical protein